MALLLSLICKNEVRQDYSSQKDIGDKQGNLPCNLILHPNLIRKKIYRILIYDHDIVITTDKRDTYIILWITKHNRWIFHWRFRFVFFFFSDASENSSRTLWRYHGKKEWKRVRSFLISNTCALHNFLIRSVLDNPGKWKHERPTSRKRSGREKWETLFSRRRARNLWTEAGIVNLKSIERS